MHNLSIHAETREGHLHLCARHLKNKMNMEVPVHSAGQWPLGGRSAPSTLPPLLVWAVIRSV